ncbi:MAG: hypothetical protein KGP28_00665 [Bdellovibrionales bacterium]|nr:hypothetical protein [Bdellovibrionales bacterium]
MSLFYTTVIYSGPAADESVMRRCLYAFFQLNLFCFPFFSVFAADPFCRDELKPGLQELAGFDADSLAKKIEMKLLTLHRVKNQGVFKVIGLPRNRGYYVRKETFTHFDPDFGIRNHGFDIRTRMKRDVATCALDRILGFNLVPETRLTRIEGGDASIQAFAKGRDFTSSTTYQKYVDEHLRKSPDAILRHKTELERMAVLDIVSGNTDRNITNFLHDPETNRIWAIDHADSFPLVEKSPGNQWFWLYWSEDLAKPMEKDTRTRILALDPKSIAARLKEKNLLEDEALSAMVRRIELLKSDVAAHPGGSMVETGARIERLIVRFSN